MNAASFLAENATPSEEEIVSAMQGNICRCGTYQRIKKAIAQAADVLASNAASTNGQVTNTSVDNTSVDSTSVDSTSDANTLSKEA